MTKSKVSTPHLPFGVRPLPTFHISASEASGLTAKTSPLQIGYFCNFLDYFERSDITPSPSKGRFSNTPFVDERLSIEI